MGLNLELLLHIPSDELTRDFFIKQSREEDYIEMLPDEDAEYDEKVSCKFG